MHEMNVRERTILTSIRINLSESRRFLSKENIPEEAIQALEGAVAAERGPGFRSQEMRAESHHVLQMETSVAEASPASRSSRNWTCDHCAQKKSSHPASMPCGR